MPAAAGKAGRPEEDSESSSEESDSEEDETLTTKAPPQVRCPIRLFQSRAPAMFSPALPLLCLFASSHLALGLSLLFLSFQAKPSRKSIQVQVASRLAKESPQKRTPTAPTGRTKPAAGQAQQQQQQQEDSSSDETHSRRASSTARVPPAQVPPLLLALSLPVLIHRPPSLTFLFVPSQAKFLGKSPQSRENTGLPEKRAAPSVGKKEEDSESSSEESDDKGDTSTAGTLAQVTPYL